MEIVFATRNQGKIREFRELIKDLNVKILSLDDIHFDEEIDEKGTTYTENALQKAVEVSKFSDKITIADDSGIEIHAYHNGPGVKSARFHPELSYEQKNERILSDLKGLSGSQRAVKYKCAVVVYMPGGKSYICRGECSGIIAFSQKGKNGFGYDPIFFLPEFEKTFAELPIEVKNRISHRGRALKKVKEILVKLTPWRAN